jgi:hypothetical protein
MMPSPRKARDAGGVSGADEGEAAAAAVDGILVEGVVVLGVGMV